MPSSDIRVLKTDDHSKEIRPFLLKSVGSLAEGAGSEAKTDNDSEAVNREEEAYKRGVSDGIQAGRLQILGEIEKELKLFRSIIEGMDKAREEIYRKIEEDVVEMSISIAKKVIYEAAEKERETVVAAAKEAIKRASDREMLKIKINPSDYETLSKRRTELLQSLDGIKSIIFEEDESVWPGGCLIETHQGDIDARVESQIRVIEGELRKATGSK